MRPDSLRESENESKQHGEKLIVPVEELANLLQRFGLIGPLQEFRFQLQGNGQIQRLSLGLLESFVCVCTVHSLTDYSAYFEQFFRPLWVVFLAVVDDSVPNRRRILSIDERCVIEMISTVDSLTFTLECWQADLNSFFISFDSAEASTSNERRLFHRVESLG